MPSIWTNISNSRYSKIVSTAALLALVASIVPSPARAQAPTLGQALDAISAFAPQALAQQGAPGVSIAITDATHTLRVITLGYADAESKTPVTADTRFGIGSITKSFTAGTLLQLRDAGTFDPNLPVTTYLPWFRIHSSFRAITSADLFTHSSGLPDGGLETGLDGIYELRDWYAGYAPGTHWTYSNVGYATLGAILYKLEGTEDFDAILRRHIFAPLDMNDTVAVWSPQTLATAARGYLYTNDDRPVLAGAELTRAPQTHYEDTAGSILTTPDDMAKYMRYIINHGNGPHGRLLSESSWKLLTTAGKHDGKTIGAGGKGIFAGYGYGLGVHAVDGDTVIGHTGGVLQYTACMQIDVARRFGVIAMSNLAYVGPRPCAIVTYAVHVLIAQAQGKALPTPPQAADPLHVVKPAQYVGTYAPREAASAFSVTASRDRLTLHAGAKSIALYPSGGDNFIVADPAWSLHLLQFGRDANKRVVEAFWGSQWYATAAYAGPTSYTYPAAWSAYLGRYDSTDANGYYGEAEVIERKGALMYDDGTPLTPLGGNLFRVGSRSWTPERVRFTTIIHGKARVLESPGGPLYRMITTPQ